MHVPVFQTETKNMTGVVYQQLYQTALTFWFEVVLLSNGSQACHVHVLVLLVFQVPVPKQVNSTLSLVGLVLECLGFKLLKIMPWTLCSFFGLIFLLNIDPVAAPCFLFFRKVYTNKSGSLSYLWTPLNIHPSQTFLHFVWKKYIRKSGYPAKKTKHDLFFLCKSFLIELLICNIFWLWEGGEDPTRGQKPLTLLHFGLCVGFWAPISP